jgi:hypothetical protein
LEYSIKKRGQRPEVIQSFRGAKFLESELFLNLIWDVVKIGSPKSLKIFYQLVSLINHEKILVIVINRKRKSNGEV